MDVTFGDGAYDSTRFREKIASKGATANISLPGNAVIGSTLDEATMFSQETL